MLFRKKLYTQMKLQIFTADINTLEKIPESDFGKIPIVYYNKDMKRIIIGKCIKVEFGFANSILYKKYLDILDQYNEPILVPIKTFYNVSTLAIAESKSVYDEIYTK